MPGRELIDRICISGARVPVLTLRGAAAADMIAWVAIIQITGDRRMATELKLNQPWMVAVWPGMGHVAISAGYYLMTKLEMHILTEFPAHELFDVEHVEVKDGPDQHRTLAAEPVLRLD